MIAYVLYGLFILACVILILVVLLQPGKADAGALFTSSVSSTAFGPRGTQTLLAKITIGAAAAFMLIALSLSLPAVSGTSSVLQSGVSDAPVTATPTPQPSPTTAVPTPTPVSTVITASPQPTAN
jgi:preprotein translocase subunit SecG